jgi:hypothetical protein
MLINSEFWYTDELLTECGEKPFGLAECVRSLGFGSPACKACRLNKVYMQVNPGIR